VPFTAMDKEWIEKSLEDWCKKYGNAMPVSIDTFTEVGYQK